MQRDHEAAIENAALLIRSLMREMQISDHLVFSELGTVSARRFLKDADAMLATRKENSNVE